VRAFAAEIRRLQADGYTCDEIRETLADVGVVVSKSTVQREAARVSPRMPPTLPAIAAAVVAPAPAARAVEREPDRLSHLPRVDDPRTARQVAEDFMKTQVTNPLLYAERKS